MGRERIHHTPLQGKIEESAIQSPQQMKGLSQIPAKSPGIYKIEVKNHVYIGQSIDVWQRLKSHNRELQRGSHPNRFMQSLFNKYGQASFKVKLIHKLDVSLYSKTQLRNVLTVLEQTYMNIYHSNLNLQPACKTNLDAVRKTRLSTVTLYHPTTGNLVISNLTQFCHLHKLDSSKIISVAQGKRVHYKGFFLNEESFQQYKLILKESTSQNNNYLDVSSVFLEQTDPLIEELFGTEYSGFRCNYPWSSEELASNLFMLYIKRYFSDAPSDITTLLETYSFNTTSHNKQNQDNYTPLCSLIPGPRSINESLQRNVFDNVLEIEFVNPIQHILTDSSFPLGTPAIYAPTKNSSALTLRQFLSKYQSRLVPGMYTIYVSGFLKAQQDIIYSSYFGSLSSIPKDICDPIVNCNNLLVTTNQIQNAVITHDTLEVLRLVGDHKMYSSWLNLKVTTAIYYPASYQLPPIQWFSKLSSLKTRSTKSLRSYWTTIPLAPFIALLKSAQVSHDAVFYVLKSLLSCFSNDEYPTANIVLANNTIAKFNLASWMLSKGLACKHMSYGRGLYQPTLIPKLNKDIKYSRKPSISSLCNDNLITSKYVKFVPICDDNPLNVDYETLDRLVTKHLVDFWLDYNLNFTLPISHVRTSKGVRAVSLPSQDSNYMIITQENQQVFRITRPKSKESIKDILRTILERSLLLTINSKLRKATPLLVQVEDDVILPQSSLFETHKAFLKATNAYKERLRYKNSKK